MVLTKTKHRNYATLFCCLFSIVKGATFYFKLIKVNYLSKLLNLFIY